MSTKSESAMGSLLSALSLSCRIVQRTDNQMQRLETCDSDCDSAEVRHQLPEQLCRLPAPRSTRLVQHSYCFDHLLRPRFKLFGSPVPATLERPHNSLTGWSRESPQSQKTTKNSNPLVSQHDLYHIDPTLSSHPNVTPHTYTHLQSHHHRRL